MRFTKKIISLCLAILMIFSFNIVSYADDTVDDSTVTSSNDEQDNGIDNSTDETDSSTQEPDESENPETPKEPEESEQPVTPQVYDYIFINASNDEVKSGQYQNDDDALKDAPENSNSVITQNSNDKTHTITPYKWAVDEEHKVTEVIDDSNAVTEDCSAGEVQVENEVKPADCLETRSYDEVYYCTVCNQELERNQKSESGHIFKVKNIKNPDCVNDGEITYVCELCQTEFTAIINHPDDHNWVEIETVNPSCNKEGEIREKCSLCGETKIIVLDKIEHDYQEKNVKPASCTLGGSITYSCSLCGDIQIKQTPPTGHSWEDDVVTKPTCTEKGYTVHHCKTCNEIESFDEVAPTGHNWSKGTCSNCGAQSTIVRDDSKVESCSPTIYFVGEEEWVSTVKLSLTYQYEGEKHVETVSIAPGEIENLNGFSTKEYNKNMKCTFTYQGKTFDVTLKCYPPRVNLYATEGNASKSASTSFSNGNSASTAVTMGNNGLKYDYDIILRDKSITLSSAASKVVTLKNTPAKENSWASGTFEVTPKNGYFDVGDNYKDYYVLITGHVNDANNTKYTLKVYILYEITSFKAVTGSTTIVCDGSTKSKEIKFRETYVDSTYKDVTVKKTLNAKSVGKKSVSYKYHSNTATYYYYVRCKAPTIKTASASKAVTVSWSKITGATGYKVYRASSKNGTYKLVKTINSGSTVKFKNTGLKSKTTYYYKVKAVYSKDSKCDSAYSSIASCKTK
jgi:hypothetical protein